MMTRMLMLMTLMTQMLQMMVQLMVFWIIGVSHLSNLLEAELIGGELIGKASRPGRKLLCDVPHTVGELERYRVGQGLLLRCKNFQE